jgi:hypothetical protein
MLLGEGVTLNGGATLTQDLLVPGTPSVTTNDNVTWRYGLGLNPEDIDLVEPDENFFAVQHGSGRLLGAPASAFASMVGDILVVEENSNSFWNIRWTGSSFRKFRIAQVSGGNFEHLTFAPAGLVEVPPLPLNPVATLAGSVTDDGILEAAANYGVYLCTNHMNVTDTLLCPRAGRAAAGTGRAHGDRRSAGRTPKSGAGQCGATRGIEAGDPLPSQRQRQGPAAQAGRASRTQLRASARPRRPAPGHAARLREADQAAHDGCDL